MTWKSRFKLFFGFIGVLLLVAALTVIFNQRQNQVASQTAAIRAEVYPIGIDYGGTVIARNVNDGDVVHKGQKLFVLQSPSLESDLNKGLISPTTVAYSVDTQGRITLTAAVAGTVAGITTQTGSFVQPGQVLAILNRAGSLFVSAQFLLSSRDYSRIVDGARVDILLPNEKSIVGKVDKVEVQTANGQAKSTIRIVSGGLVDGAYNGLVEPGTPVNATLQLRNDGPLAGVSDGWGDFLRKIGL